GRRRRRPGTATGRGPDDNGPVTPGVGRRVLVVSATVALAVAAACGGDDTATRRPAGDPAIVVAAYDFTESQVLAELYGQALEGAGFYVRRVTGLASREVVEPAL